MLHKEIRKFMALAPLTWPTLIEKGQMETDIAEDSAVLFFDLNEAFPVGYVMDVLEDNWDLKLLYHATLVKIHHVCYFSNPRDGHLMYKINFHTNKNEYVETIIVTLFDSMELWEEDLETDIKAHQEEFEIITGVERKDLLSIFCKLNYDG